MIFQASLGSSLREGGADKVVCGVKLHLLDFYVKLEEYTLKLVLWSHTHYTMLIHFTRDGDVVQLVE